VSWEEFKEETLMIRELQLNKLPDLPQRETIEEAASNLWQDAGVVALWVGGSLASGKGDLLSDVDFRVAVAPEQFTRWEAPPFERIFSRTPVVGRIPRRFGDKALFHHLVLSNGVIVDFFVQSTSRRPTQEPLLILGCRSEEFERLLSEQNSVPPMNKAVDGNMLAEFLVSFWINSLKHHKVLFRGLDLMVTQGLSFEQGMLIRLWYIEASGQDCGDVRQQTIHGLTEVVRIIDRSVGAQALRQVGAPTRDRQEIIQTIERHRQIVSQLGRRLAQQYGFEYPAALEATVLESWQKFLAGE
jgi:hypothetical protein